MARLPQPGGDEGNWGDILNTYLAEAHNADGSLKNTGLLASKYTRPGSGIPMADLSSAVQSAISNATGATGAAGNDGREVQLQASATHIQWRYVGTSTWSNLLPLSDITGPQGSQGPAGQTGPAGADSTVQGPAGTAGTNGSDGADGREVELQTSSTHVQWRYVGESVWNNLTSLADLTGPQGPAGADGQLGPVGTSGTNGNDGREVELQTNTTHVQWRYVGTSTWTDLISLVDLIGPQGPAGNDGADGQDGTSVTILGTYATQGELTTAHPAGSLGDAYMVAGDLYVWNGTAWDNVGQIRGPQGPTGADGSDGPAGTPGTAGTNGNDGREVELQTNTTHVQWRYAGDGTWTDLEPLADLRGPAGNDGPDGSPGVAGNDGREVELQNNTTHVQWRYAGSPTWTDLAELSDLTGPPGEQGPQGPGVPVTGVDAIAVVTSLPAVPDPNTLYIIQGN